MSQLDLYMRGQHPRWVSQEGHQAEAAGVRETDRTPVQQKPLTGGAGPSPRSCNGSTGNGGRDAQAGKRLGGGSWGEGPGGRVLDGGSWGEDRGEDSGG